MPHILQTNAAENQILKCNLAIHIRTCVASITSRRQNPWKSSFFYHRTGHSSLSQPRHGRVYPAPCIGQLSCVSIASVRNAQSFQRLFWMGRGSLRRIEEPESLNPRERTYCDYLERLEWHRESPYVAGIGTEESCSHLDIIHHISSSGSFTWNEALAPQLRLRKTKEGEED
jgi:hypothetical protein